MRKLLFNDLVSSKLCYPLICPMDSAFLFLITWDQAPAVEKADKFVHWINLYPVDNAIGFPDTYSLDSDLSSG